MADPRKYPRLYAMQARAARLEAEISEPYRYAVTVAQDELRRTRKALETIEGAIRSKMIDYVLKDISFRISDKVRLELQKAVMDAMKGKDRPQFIQLHLSTGDIAFMDPNSLEKRALEVWQRETAPKMRIRAYADGATAFSDSVAILQVSLPEMHYRHAMMDG